MTQPHTPFPFDPPAYFRVGQMTCAKSPDLTARLHRIACKDPWMQAMLGEGLNNPIAHRDIASIAAAAFSTPPPTIAEVRAALAAPEPMPPRLQIAWCVLDGWFAGA